MASEGVPADHPSEVHTPDETPVPASGGVPEEGGDGVTLCSAPENAPENDSDEKSFSPDVSPPCSVVFGRKPSDACTGNQPCT